MSINKIAHESNIICEEIIKTHMNTITEKMTNEITKEVRKNIMKSIEKQDLYDYSKIVKVEKCNITDCCFKKRFEDFKNTFIKGEFCFLIFRIGGGGMFYRIAVTNYGNICEMQHGNGTCYNTSKIYKNNFWLPIDYINIIQKSYNNQYNSKDESINNTLKYMKMFLEKRVCT